MVTRIRILLAICLAATAVGQENAPSGSLNNPERLGWFCDQGFGLFIHRSVDWHTATICGAEKPLQMPGRQ